MKEVKENLNEVTTLQQLLTQPARVVSLKRSKAKNNSYGCTITNIGSYRIIEEVKIGGPADLTGLTNGDRVWSVNGKDVSEMVNINF